eukprot:GHVU01014119.1.p1 GENE.GHVU01014119.1~~GHVU01014119.1.p1  ORF type:complete len:173 (+),score=17.21 GHVU01014119.1:106-624(+)
MASRQPIPSPRKPGEMAAQGANNVYYYSSGANRPRAVAAPAYNYGHPPGYPPYPVPAPQQIPPPAGPRLAPRGQIHGAHENLRRVLDDNATLEHRIEKLQREVAEAKGTIDSLNQQVVQFTQENADLKEELAVYERARNHPMIGEALRILIRNANQPVAAENGGRGNRWCFL